MVPGEISHGVSSGFSSRISLSLDFFRDSFQCFLLPPGISPKYFFLFSWDFFQKISAKVFPGIFLRLLGRFPQDFLSRHLQKFIQKFLQEFHPGSLAQFFWVH